MRFLIALLMITTLGACHAQCGEKWWQERCPIIDDFPDPQP